MEGFLIFLWLEKLLLQTLYFKKMLHKKVVLSPKDLI